MTDLSIPDQIAALDAWPGYKIVFPDGSEVGRGEVYPIDQLDKLLDGVDLRNRSVLEIGCAAGHMTLWLLQNSGARSVHAIEVLPAQVAQARFVLEQWGFMPECVAEGSIYALDPVCHRREYVICSGCVYHLRHPLYGLEKAWACAEDCMIVEGQVLDIDDPCTAGKPLQQFNKNGVYGDATNWTTPTKRCLLDWLESLDGVGRIVEVKGLPYNFRAAYQVWRGA
jgi:SAM-dependent methyltransferase